MKLASSLSFFLWTLVESQALFNPKNIDSGSSGAANPSIPLDISSLYNNRGFAIKPNDSSFDGEGTGYPGDALPPSNFIYNGINFTFPQYKSAGNDNVLALGQVVQVPQGRYFSVQMFASCENGLASGFINATYSDNSTSSSPVLVPAWYNWPYPAGGDIILPHYYTNSTTNYNRSMFYLTTNWIDSTKELVSLTLPNVTSGSNSGPGGAAVETRLHLFSVSVLPASGTSIELEIQYARSTQSWLPGTNKTQIVEVIVNNVGSDWVLANNSVKVTVSSPGYKTVTPGYISRLRPGDQAKVQVGVVNSDGVEPGAVGNANVLISGTGVNASYTFNATYGIAQYEATYESVYTHESPSWYNDGKYGIFIHWGVYAVPGWGNVGKNESYAEWYWWDENLGPNTSVQTYEYNLKTYGPDHVYDDFIQNFTASAWDPKEWVDLFADAGASYFVQVTKHHDGYAIFDLPANVTKRTSVAQFPHRNLLQELFDAAAQYQPQLHRATYFSLPEWFNPAYAKYGFGSWPGGNATNPYTNKTLPYTGFVEVNDYVEDVILPEMQALADMGTEIMWCDIGGPNLTAEFASAWFNTQAEQGKQVVIDNRCGLPGDFDTPEYARYDAVQTRKWESNLGMDPFSYGYNRASPDSTYMNASNIVTSLLDIVSKNGNFLLDVGPQANGTIIEVEQDNLRQAGVWIKDHAEAIFNTTYWFITPEENKGTSEIRFTQTMDAFYIVSLTLPDGSILLDSPVPWVKGDAITVVGGNSSGTVVPSQMLSNGSLLLNVSNQIQEADEFAWVFKISYTEQNGSNGTSTPNGSLPTPSATTTISEAPGSAAKGCIGLLCLSLALFAML